MRYPERWLAVLRVVVGLWFCKAVVTKLAITLLWGLVPVPTASVRWYHSMLLLLTRYTAGDPPGFYKRFIEDVVIPHGALFAQLTAFGEVAVGVGLTLGLGTRVAATLGLWLVLNYGLATSWQGMAQQGFHLMLATAMVMLMGAGAGRVWGLDGWIRARRPLSALARLPVG